MGQMNELFRQKVKNCAIFNDASEETFDRLFEVAHVANYPKNKQIYSQDDHSTDFHIVMEGVVRAKSFSPDGKEVTYNDIEDGNLFGEFAALDESPRSASIIATTEVTTVKLPASFLHWAVEHDGKVAMALLQLQIVKIRTLTERVYEFSVLAVRQRVQAEILRVALSDGIRNENQVKITIPTHQEFANRISTHREAITRELRFLASQSLVKITRREVVITDINLFAKFAGNLAIGEQI